jgi:hypothetical protein
MATFFAVCHFGCPVSVKIEADGLDAAIAAFELLRKENLIQDDRCDADDTLGIDSTGHTEDEFAVMLEAAGCTPVKDLSSVANHQGRTAGHLANGWVLWMLTDKPAAKRDSNVFILVFRPHQRPAWAQSFRNNEEFIEAWRNGDFDQSCLTNCDLSEEDQEPTYNNAYSDVGHDLALLTRLHSADEARKYLMHSNFGNRHNKGIGAVLKVAVELGWVHEDWMESFQTISEHFDIS